MAFKPNYNQLRNDRNRAKQSKKNEKARLLQEETAKRKTAGEDEPEVPAPDESAGIAG